MKETLQIIGKYTVESSSGWKVEIPSFDVLIYEEEGKSIRLALEDRPDAQGELEWIIYTPEAWRWNERKDEIRVFGPRDLPNLADRFHDWLRRSGGSA